MKLDLRTYDARCRRAAIVAMRLCVWSAIVLPALLRSDRPAIDFAFAAAALPLVCLWRATPSARDRILFAATFLTPLTACFGSAPLFVVWATIAFSPGSSPLCSRSRVRWAVPLLVLLGATWLIEVAHGLPALYSGLRSIPDLTAERAFDLFASWAATWCPSWLPIARWMLFVMLVGVFEGSRRIEIAKYLGAGTVAAAVFIVARATGIIDIPFPEEGSFWKGIHRVGGTFTDPNAAGVYLALATFATFPWWSRLRPFVIAAVVVPWLLAALFSGSRSFFLGLAVASVVAAYRRMPRAVLKAALVPVALVVIVSVLDASTSTIDDLSAHPSVPPGAKRVVTALSISRFEQTLQSRAVFLELAKQVLTSPMAVTGIGPNRFRYFVPAASKQASIDLGGWIDNSNNFYLGLFIEWGLIGAAVFLVAASRRRFRDEGGFYERLGMYALAAMLVTGPHLDFIEVTVLAAVLVAAATTPRIEAANPAWGGVAASRALTALALLFGVLREAGSNRGSYDWEREGRSYHQWLFPVSRVSVACGCDQVREIPMELAILPKGESVVATAVIDGGPILTVKFERPGVKSLMIPCPGPPNGATMWRPPRRMLSIRIDRAESPAWSSNQSGDHRVFGARLRDRSFRDLLEGVECEAGSNGEGTPISTRPR